MTIHTAATTAALLLAATIAKPGDTIKLAPGSYSKVVLRGLIGPLTLTSADPKNRAVLNDLALLDSTGINLTDLITMCPAGSLTWYNHRIERCTGITLTRLLIDGPGLVTVQDTTGLIVRWSKGVKITGCEVRNLSNGILCLDNVGLTVTDNYFHDLRRDGIDHGGCSEVLIENNLFTNFHPNATDHPDAIQFWTHNTTTPAYNITVRGNVIVRGARGGQIQGVFVKDEVGTLRYQNLIVTDNLVVGGHYNGINLDGVQSGALINNSVIQFPDQKSFIRVMNSGAIEQRDNLAAGFVDAAVGTAVPPASDGGLRALAAWQVNRPPPGGLPSWGAALVAIGLLSGGTSAPAPVLFSASTLSPVPDPAPVPKKRKRWWSLW